MRSYTATICSLTNFFASCPDFGLEMRPSVTVAIHLWVVLSCTSPIFIYNEYSECSICTPIMVQDIIVHTIFSYYWNDHMQVDIFIVSRVFYSLIPLSG